MQLTDIFAKLLAGEILLSHLVKMLYLFIRLSSVTTIFRKFFVRLSTLDQVERTQLS